MVTCSWEGVNGEEENVTVEKIEGRQRQILGREGVGRQGESSMSHTLLLPQN